MHRKLTAAIAALTVTAALSYQALAQTTPEDALDYRKAVMTSLRGHIGASCHKKRFRKYPALFEPSIVSRRFFHI